MDNEKIDLVRHSLAHLLAAAVVELWPDALPTLGPAIDTGFYYDFEFASPISDKDFEKIENKMGQIAKHWKGFEKKEISYNEAKKLFARNPYKLELIEEINNKGESITTYTSGSGEYEFTDLCRGGHIDDISKIPTKSWKLERIAGAYWRGDEKNKMLTRVYGLAFESKEALVAFEAQQEEARKRDHRKLGKELKLFTLSDLVGPGLPLMQPKGMIIRKAIEDYLWELHKNKGYGLSLIHI